MNNELIEKIALYISGTMTETEKQLFEKEMQKNKYLSKSVFDSIKDEYLMESSEFIKTPEFLLTNNEDTITYKHNQKEIIIAKTLNGLMIIKNTIDYVKAKQVKKYLRNIENQYYEEIQINLSDGNIKIIKNINSRIDITIEIDNNKKNSVMLIHQNTNNILYGASTEEKKILINNIMIDYYLLKINDIIIPLTIKEGE